LAYCASDVGINWMNNKVNYTFKLKYLCTDKSTYYRSLASDYMTKLLCGFLKTLWLLQNPPVSSSRFYFTTVLNVYIQLENFNHFRKEVKLALLSNSFCMLGELLQAKSVQ
jgi:hypothetical protein